MKKISKSPEETEVTPSKKILKQARLPFMLLSDVSPKAETPPSRKRKLSVPDPEPVTKVGKIAKENSISEDLVVISDDECKSVPKKQTEDKPLNPFVKLVDTAWKKKQQKAKDQKKSKTRLTKKQTKNQSQDSSSNNECDDVEMVEVDVIIHENGERRDSSASDPPNGDIVSQTIETSSPTVKPPLKNSEPTTVEMQKETAVSPKTSVENKTETTSVDKSDIVCLDSDSNNSSDVSKFKNKKNNLNLEQTESSIQPKRGKVSQKDTKQKKTVTPKRSSRIEAKVKETETNNETVKIVASSDKDQVKSKDDQKEKPNNFSKSNLKTDLKDAEHSSSSEIPTTPKAKRTESPNNLKTQKTTEISKDVDSDIEMIESTENTSTIVSPRKNDSEKTSDSDSNQESESTKSQPTLVTPKRSSRNKNKADESLNTSTTSSKLDESISSNPSTPKHNRSLSDGQIDKSVNDSVKSDLTPKQLQKKQEYAKKREEREKEKQEREKKRQQEKEERAKQRQEKEDQKKKEREEKEEAKRREKEEKEEQKRKEREEKEKQKEQERKMRELKEEQKKKEKEDKEEQKRKEREAREEDKRKKQEALELEKQEQELKKKKAAEAFANFFVPKQRVEKEPQCGPVSKSSVLSSFTIKVDMRLAPTCRADLSEDKRDVLDKCLEEQNSLDDLYLKCLKDGSAKPLSMGKTWPLDEKDEDEVMIVEDELPPIDGASEVITCESAPREKLRPKLLSFHDNRRPPYWGTWRRKSAHVTPRRPFAQEKQLDYEVDSDDDWEDEQDGESLDGSAGGSDDEAGADDYEVDNEVFVPHGYLSDEEATMDEEDDVLSLSPETQKARLKHLEDEFESELKKPTEKLKPRLYGLLWENSEGGKPEKCVDALWNYFRKFAMILNDPTPLLQPLAEPEVSGLDKKKTKKKKALPEGEANEQSPKAEKKKKVKPEHKESKKPKTETKKTLPNQPGINSFLKKVNTT